MSVPKLLRMDSGHVQTPCHPKPYLVVGYSPVQRIYSEGDRAGAVYRVVSGTVRVCTILSDGRRQVVSFHLKGEFFGYETMPTHRFFAEAVGAATVTKSALESKAVDTATILRTVTDELLRAQAHVVTLGRRDAREKVALFLMDLANRSGDGHLELPMIRSDIADHLGLTLETVSRVFADMKKRGMIGIHSARDIQILKPDVLKGWCG